MSLRLELLLCELDAALVSLLPSWGLPGCKGEDGPISSFLSFLLPLSDGGFADSCKQTASPNTPHLSRGVSGFADPF